MSLREIGPSVTLDHMASKIVRLTVVFESAEEGGFIARVPSLPGCETQGETLEEAEEMVRTPSKRIARALRSMANPFPFSREKSWSPSPSPCPSDLSASAA